MTSMFNESLIKHFGYKESTARSVVNVIVKYPAASVARITELKITSESE